MSLNGLGMSIQFFEILIFLCYMALVTSLVGLVQLLVVSNTVFPDSVKDFEPAFSQAPKGDVVHSTLGTFSLIELYSPTTVPESSVESEMDKCLAKRMITGSSLPNFFGFT